MTSRFPLRSQCIAGVHLSSGCLSSAARIRAANWFQELPPEELFASARYLSSEIILGIIKGEPDAERALPDELHGDFLAGVRLYDEVVLRRLSMRASAPHTRVRPGFSIGVICTSPTCTQPAV